MKDILKISPLTKVGSKVNIDLERINDQISSDLKNLLSKHPYGEVFDYRITDGTQIGFVLKLNDGSKAWFFNDEIIEFNKEKNAISISKENDSLIINNSISYILNPLNFLKWLLFSLKDNL